MFLTNRAFRKHYGNAPPVLIWLNLDSKQEVDDLHEAWSRCQPRIVSRPESKPGSVASSPQQTLVATCCAFSTTSRGKPAEGELRVAMETFRGAAPTEARCTKWSES
jgi:hypothetical protein